MTSELSHLCSVELLLSNRVTVIIAIVYEICNVYVMTLLGNFLLQEKADHITEPCIESIQGWGSSTWN